MNDLITLTRRISGKLYVCCVTIDYGPCPVRPCENGALCAKRGSSPKDYYCSCQEGFTGRYCESKIVDLSPLIILPIFLAVLMLLMLCLCCCACCCWGAGDSQQVPAFISPKQQLLLQIAISLSIA